DSHASTAVCRNDVARAGSGPSDDVRGGAVEDANSGERVGYGSTANNIRADEIAFDKVRIRSKIADEHALGSVSRQQISRSRRCPTDGVRLRAAEKSDAGV